MNDEPVSAELLDMMQDNARRYDMANGNVVAIGLAMDVLVCVAEIRRLRAENEDFAERLSQIDPPSQVEEVERLTAENATLRAVWPWVRKRMVYGGQQRDDECPHCRRPTMGDPRFPMHHVGWCPMHHVGWCPIAAAEKLMEVKP